MANDGVNRSFAGVYDGSKNLLAAQDAAERLHLILQREDAIVARGPGTQSCVFMHAACGGVHLTAYS